MVKFSSGIHAFIIVCLGVVKKLINMWLFGPISHRLSKTNIQSISSYLIEIKSCIPPNFVKKTRPLNKVARWKAIELDFFIVLWSNCFKKYPFI